MAEQDEPLRSQLNDLYRIIQGINLRPSDFALTKLDRNSRTWSGMGIFSGGTPSFKWSKYMELAHKREGLFFRFDQVLVLLSRTQNTWSSYFLFERWPDDNHGNTGRGCEDWKKLKAKFSEWAKLVSTELAEPNLWTQEAPIESLFHREWSRDNATFTESEKNAISIELDEIKKLLIDNFCNTEQDKEIITQRITYLIEAMERLGRVDWVNISISTIISIIITLSLDREIGNKVVNLLKNAITPYMPRLLGS